MNQNATIQQQTTADLRALLKPLESGFMPNTLDDTILFRSILERGIRAEIQSRSTLKLIDSDSTYGKIQLRVHH